MPFVTFSRNALDSQHICVLLTSGHHFTLNAALIRPAQNEVCIRKIAGNHL